MGEEEEDDDEEERREALWGRRVGAQCIGRRL